MKREKMKKEKKNTHRWNSTGTQSTTQKYTKLHNFQSIRAARACMGI